MQAAALKLLEMARRNGGGFEPRDVLGPAADDMDHAILFGSLDQHEALSACLRAGAVEAVRDDVLDPPVLYMLTPAGEKLLDSPEP